MANNGERTRLLSRVARERTQAHIRYVSAVPQDRARGLVARVYAQLERDFGILAPPISLHAPAPDSLAAAWLMLRESLVASGVVRRPVKEAVAVAVSLANACPYCVEVHGTALHGLVRLRDARAVADGRTDLVADPDLRWATSWARGGTGWPAAAPAPPPVPAGQAPELVGTAVTFHYLNRMVNLFLAESPIPSGVPAAVRPAIRRLAGALLRPVLRRRAAPGDSLELLPAAQLPADLAWATGTSVIADAFARAAAAIDAAGHRSVPAPVRELVAARLAAWDGLPPGPSRAWADRATAGLPVGDRPAGRLALLTALASYQVGPSVVEAFRRDRPDDRDLIEVAAWASLAAARRLGGWLWQGPTAAGQARLRS
jgi:AhpD family alkylhydroperoxidase